MPAMRVSTDQDHEALAYEIGLDKLPVLHTTADWVVDALENGMQSGATSLMVMIPVSVEGADHMVMAETSLQLWMNTASILAAKYQDEVGAPGWAILPQAARDALRPRYAEAIRRAIPSATAEQAEEAAEMMFDALGADAPPEYFEQP
jgi:hypothetical protein